MRIDYSPLHKRLFDPYKHTLFIFDENTYKHHSNKIIALELNKSIKYYEYIIPCGESSKDFTLVEEICEFLSSNNFPRKDSCIIAVGGGVVGDLAGFIASIYMRGVDFIQVPTTLLAMVDSSIGGKNGINNKHGKNLIGTIRQPNKIIIDILFLETLPIEEFSNGMAEIIKIAATSNHQLWNILYKHNLENVMQNKDLLLNIIKLAGNTKLRIVEQDEFEMSDDIETSRMVLNYGHTIGHAIEKITGERHGYCVAVGMVLEIDRTNILIRKLIISCLSKYGLPTDVDDSMCIEKLIDYIKCDKKGNRMITLDNIGSPRIVEYEDSDIYKLFQNNINYAIKDIIVLIGMPGIGKSTYGRYIANELHMKWIDTDDEILKVIDCSILDFINKFGWDEFRKLEYKILCDVVQQDNVIISTGGGIIEYEKSRKLLNIIQYSILLRRDDHDDIEKNNIYEMTYQSLWEKRKHWYRQCSRYEHYTTSKYDFKDWLDKIMNKFVPTIHSTFLSLANNHFYELDIPRGVSCIEYRYDLYPDNMEYDIHALHLITENPILFTDHSFSGMEEFAQRIGCTMIDVDMEKNISFNKYPNTYVIASIHCDDYEKIVHIVNSYVKMNDPDMIKIVSDIRIQTDLDKYVKKLEKKYKVIHLYKGIKGRMSRILNKYLTPVCGENSETKTDEGQLSIVDLVKSRRLLFEGGDRIEKYCLFGKPICHSKSPEIHNRFFDDQNWLATYYKYETYNPIVAFREFQKSNLMGASITIPLKESLIQYVDICSKDVKEIGVLNTLTRLDDGRIKGDNTDWLAIYDEIYKLDLMNTFILRNSIRAYVIGTGATAKSACYAIQKLGYKLYIKGRSREKMEDFHKKYGATVVDENSVFIAMDIIIITIPGCVELDLREYKDSVCIIEMAYNDVMKRKYPKYAKIIDGRTILYEQAIYQNKIWSKRV
jgi:3-dehydroquinate synthase